MSEPKHELLIHGEVVDWLSSAPYCIGKWTVREMLRSGAIPGKALPGTKRKRYCKSQILRDVLKDILTEKAEIR